jgi:fatty acid kinase
VVQVAKRLIERGTVANGGDRTFAAQPATATGAAGVRFRAMPDPSIARFRRVVTAAYASLEQRRQEVNDLNVFPVADGDTGDNMAMTMRAVMEELDRLDGLEVDEVGRAELVQALARAALMGARGNSGVILSQIVRGAAEELASRPGELVDPVLVASAFASAADAAYASVRDPAEGTMLTVFREMAHSIARQLAHLEADRQRLDRGVSDEQQDAVLAEVLEQAIADGQRAVERTPEQLGVLRDSGVVDAGGYGLVLILAGVVAGLRGEGSEAPEVDHHEPARLSRPHHEDSRFRYCTNFIVSGAGLDARVFLPRLEGLGDSVLVVGDEVTLKVHVHTDEPESAVAVFEGAGEVTNLDVADMREQIAARDARLEAGGRTGVLAVAAGEGLERLFGELGAHVVPGGETLNPSTYELLAGIHEVPAEEVLVLPGSSNVIMAAERACELSEKPARVVAATSQQEALLALVEFDPEAPAGENAERLAAALEAIVSGGVAPAARDDAQGRFRKGDAVGFAGEEIVAYGGAGSTLAATIEKLAEGAEIVTVLAGEGAPIPLEEIDAHVPDGVEVETHSGGQPSWWWLLAAQ